MLCKVVLFFESELLFEFELSVAMHQTRAVEQNTPVAMVLVALTFLQLKSLFVTLHSNAIDQHFPFFLQSAVEEVNRRNLQSMVSPMPIDPVNPILMIVVKRENIVEHTLTQIMKCGPYDLKKPLKVMLTELLKGKP